MRNKIIFLECTRHYSYKFSASNTKFELLAKGLLHQKDDVIIVDSIIGEKELTKPFSGYQYGIRYHLFPRKGFLIYNMIKNFFSLLKLIKSESNSNAKKIIVLTCPFYPLFILYVIIAKIYRYKVVSVIDEWHIALEVNGFWDKMNKISNSLLDNTFGYFVDGILPISHFLLLKIKHFHKPTLLLPILAEFECPLIRNECSLDYFLYCGSCGYSRIISIIISGFDKFVHAGGKQNLILVLSGDTRLIEAQIESCGLSDRVFIWQNVAYSKLLQLYNGALALLIPLSPHSLQDKARFSQKIAEYLSSSRPIVTVDVGEIPYYFENKVNAFILKDFTDNSLNEVLQFISKNLDLANFVGINGYKTGKQSFDNLTISDRVHNYFCIL